ncbi:MAG: biopolymer transporter ExbD [Planctomycetota bacterium]
MLIRVKDPDGPALDMTPMIDCVFNLLVFFLVATTFQQAEREMHVALPFANSAAPISTALRELVINVDAQGKTYVSGRPIELGELKTMIEGLVRDNPEQKVSVRGDRTTAYENVVRVLDLCKASGIQQPYLDTILGQ